MKKDKNHQIFPTSFQKTKIISFSNFMQKDKNDQILPTSRKKTKIIKLSKKSNTKKSRNSEIPKICAKNRQSKDKKQTKWYQNKDKSRLRKQIIRSENHYLLTDNKGIPL